MEYRPLGRTGLEVSAVGLGGNVFGGARLDRAHSIRNIHHALAEGINFIDTAYLYNDGESESFIGEATRDRRESVIIATKFHLIGMQEGEQPAARIRSQVETSLRRLQTDHIDLLQIHFPAAEYPHQLLLEPLAELVAAGKVRALGQCNYAAWRHLQSDVAAAAMGAPGFDVAQNQYNLLHRSPELELLGMCRARGVGFLPYFPLAGGFLSGKYRPGEPPPPGSRGAADSPVIRRARSHGNEQVVQALEDWAGERGHGLLDLAFAWLLAEPAVASVIAGTMSMKQIDGNIAAGDWRLSAEERAEVSAIAAWDGDRHPVEPTLDFFR